MRDDPATKLERLGLSAAESQVYFALVRSGGTLGASAVAAATGVPRTNVYPILQSLLDKGIVEADAGYGSRFTAVRPKQALPSLIARAREDLFQREHLARELVEQLESLAEPAENNGEGELIQVLRDPRVVAERFERLQQEARQQIDVFIKAPIINPPYTNPTQEKAMRRGVRCRGLYESATLDAPEVEPYLQRWIAAGEEARVHRGDLPHKLAIFDKQNILMPLITSRGQGRTLFIRHPQLATSLGMLFETLWEHAKPFPAEVQAKGQAGQTAEKPIRTRHSKRRPGPNGRGKRHPQDTNSRTSPCKKN